MHVKDASRSVGVVERLTRPEQRRELDRENRVVPAEGTRERSPSAGSASSSPMRRPCKRRFRIDWKQGADRQAVVPGRPRAARFSAGGDRAVHRLVAVLHGMGAAAANIRRSSRTPRSAPRRSKLFDDAERLLEQIVPTRLLTANAVYGFYPANSRRRRHHRLHRRERGRRERLRLPMLRQQWEREGQTAFRSLADYVAPVDSGRGRLSRRLRGDGGLRRGRIGGAVSRRTTTTTTPS